METIKIGGNDYEVRFKYVTCQKIIKKFNKIFTENKYDAKKNKAISNIANLYADQYDELKKMHEANAITEEEYQKQYKELVSQESQMITATKTMIPDTYFFEATWDVLVKKGFWIFRKPFKSMKHMINEIDKDEAVAVIHIIGSKILGYNQEEDKKKMI